METMRITESEIMAALAAAAAGDAPDEARTSQEMATAAGVSVRHVVAALKLFQAQGRLHVHRVMRMALDGRRATVAGYTITPAAKRKK